MPFEVVETILGAKEMGFARVDWQMRLFITALFPMHF